MEDVKEKQCHHCHDTKPIEAFNRCKTGMFGYHNHCRECQKNIKRAWYLKHQQQEINKSKTYSQSDAGKQSRQKRWQKLKHVLGPKQNARRRLEPAKIKARIQQAKWYAIPHNQIAQTQRARVRNALKGIAKTAHTEELIGCTFEQLRDHLQTKFFLGMSWSNYGEWDIDHIKPCASFDLTDPQQQKECFNYTNLQPLWKRDNQSKGCRQGNTSKNVESGHLAGMPS